MKKSCTALLAMVLAGWGAPPAHAQKKDTLLLMQRLDTMQQMMINMQKTVDTQTAVLKTLIEQANDNVNSMKAQMEELKKSTGQNLANNGARFDSMSGEIQSLTSTQEEILARLAKLSEQLAQTQNIIQTLNTPAPPPPGATGSPGPIPPTVPDAADGATFTSRHEQKDLDVSLWVYRAGTSFHAGHGMRDMFGCEQAHAFWARQLVIPEVCDLLDQAYAVELQDQDAAFNLYAEAQRVLHENFATGGIIAQPNIFGVDENLVWTPHPNDDNWMFAASWGD